MGLHVLGIFLEQGRIEDAISMYTEVQRWKEAIDVAESRQHEESETLKATYYKWLMETRQEEQAGRLKEKEGDHHAAIALYLKGGVPGRAAQTVMDHGVTNFPADLIETILSSLLKANMNEKAGELYEQLGQYENAKEAYRRGHAYRHCVDLCRRHFPGEVIRSEEEFGDWLVSQRQVDAALNHFIEAGQGIKAIEAALESRQWSKAAAVVEQQPPEVAKGYFQRIARHYEQSKVNPGGAT